MILLDEYYKGVYSRNPECSGEYSGPINNKYELQDEDPR